MMRNCLQKMALVAVLPSLLISPLASADFSGSVGLTNSYLPRGITASDDKLSLSAGVHYSNPKNGAFAGVKAHTLGGESPYTQYDTYVGMTKPLSEKASVDIGVLSYQWPDNKAATDTRPSHGEELFLTGRYGMADASVYHFINTPLMKGSTYVRAGVKKPLKNGITVGANVGHNSYGDSEEMKPLKAFGVFEDYNHYQVSAAWKDLTLAVGAADIDNAWLKATTDPTVTLTWEKNFGF